MRVGSTLPKMESKSMVTKMTMNMDASHNGQLPEMEDVTQSPGAAGASSMAAAQGNGVARSARITGKRTTRDEPTEFQSGRQSPSGPPAFGGFDMASVSSLGRELMERKRQMLSQVVSSSVDADMALAKGSDDDSDSGIKGKTSVKNETDGNVKSEPLTEEDIQKRKAQRRREQVRAASRRCRDRQRRETEELRMKVFQLEEFISHSMQSYELELRRQRQQIEVLQQENDTLRARQLAGERPLSSTSSPASVGSVSLSLSMYGVKPEPIHDSPPPHTRASSNQHEAHFTWDPVRIQNMHETVEECKRAMISIQNSSQLVDIRRQAFGWNFDFWSQDSRYFVKTCKFFRGMRASDVADRNFNVDYVKYIETFPEVKEKKVVQQLSSSVQIVEVVKDLPGKGLVSSLNATFLSRDENFERPGERWAVGTISVGSANHVQFSHEDECNGYIFQDATQVTSDGREVQGCLAVGTGRFEAKGKELRPLMEDMAKIFASVVIRWESLFINDYMEEEGEAVDEIDELDF